MKHEKIMLSSFLLLILVLGVSSIFNKSMTWDETCYVGAGKYLIKTGNFKFSAFAFHPPMTYYIGSIFLMPLKFDDSVYSTDFCYEFGEGMIYNSSYNPKTLLLLSRLPFVIMSMVLAFYVFRWSKEIYGQKSGYLALVLYTFSTAILSASNLVLTDFTVGFFMFLSLYYYWKFYIKNLRKHIYLASIFVGCALLSKLTGLIIIPILTILIIYESLRYGRNSRNLLIAAKNILVVVVIASLVLFAGFGFHIKPMKNSIPQHFVGRVYEELENSRINNNIKSALTFAFEKVPVPFPEYFFVFSSVSLHSVEGHGGFLNGQFYQKSPWYYPLHVFLYKTELAFIIIIALSIIFFKKTRAKNTFEEIIQILPIVFIFILFMSNNLTTAKHIVPAYPFLFLFCSRLGKIKLKSIKLLLWILIIYYVVSSAMAFPNYLAYFNEISGGPANGYKHLVGASIDLGQDLPGLQKYMQENVIHKINLSYFGTVDPKEYVDYDYMPSPYFQMWVPGFKRYEDLNPTKEDCHERKGWIAISVTNLQNVRMENKTCYNWLQKYQPVAKIGYSIFVYNLTNTH